MSLEPRTDGAGEIIVPNTTDGIFFAPLENRFYRKVASGTWEGFTQGDTKLHLRMMGLRESINKGETFSPVEAAIHRIQEHQNVQYAGPLAGHAAGLRSLNGIRVLVTTDPVWIEPGPGDFPVLRALLDNMFEWESEQCAFLMGWLKYGWEAYRAGIHRPGQVVAIAGDVNCGKSFLQKVVFTKLFGGRKADPMRYMSGRSDFNSDLAANEHLMIEDAVSSTRLDIRRHMGSVMKQFAVNRSQSIQGKFVNSVDLDPRWRVSITLNREPENICGLPPLDESLADKLALLMADKKPMPMPMDTPEQQNECEAVILSELPAFVRFLQEWEPAEDARCSRFGVRAFQHRDMLDALQEHAPEIKLMSLIDADPFPRESDLKWTKPWKGTAETIEQELMRGDSKFAAQRLFTWQGACGSYLGRLAAHPRFKSRVESDRSAYRRMWTLHPPG
jgi:hypothetical protein